MALAVVSAVYAGYTYVTNLQQENVRLERDKAKLESNVEQLKTALETQTETISALERDYARSQELQQQTFQEFQGARDRVTSLEKRLEEHELGFLAANRPGLVENVINKASDNIARCFEIASGSPLTQAELNATLPSQINRECPELANPNYRGDQ